MTRPNDMRTGDNASALTRKKRRFRLDPLVTGIVGMLLLAMVLPAKGAAGKVVNDATSVSIGLLFFLYGARLSLHAVATGLMHWRLQLTVFLSTFLLFPIIGGLMSLLWRPILGAGMASGLLFLSALPSTVQSSIAFTAIARGNVPAALCSASLSNLVGVVLSPLLIGLLFSAQGGFSAHQFLDIALQLLAPFMAGQFMRPLIGNWLERHRPLTLAVDRGSIFLIVYSAFSESTNAGLWHQLDLTHLAALVLADLLLLGLVLGATTLASRLLRFRKADEITIVFCGSKKSLAAGLPIANILLAGHHVGLLVLPLMLFHQIQLMVCSLLAQRYAARPEAGGAPATNSQPDTGRFAPNAARSLATRRRAFNARV